MVVANFIINIFLLRGVVAGGGGGGGLREHIMFGADNVGVGDGVAFSCLHSFLTIFMVTAVEKL